MYDSRQLDLDRAVDARETGLFGWRPCIEDDYDELSKARADWDDGED